MVNAALQPGTTPGLCPYGHTNCVPAVDAAESAQRIRQLEELRAENRQLSTKNQRLEEDVREKDKQIEVKDDQLMVQGKQLIVQSEQLISQSKQLRAKNEPIKRPPEQTTSPVKTKKKTKRKRASQKDIENRNRIIAIAAAEISGTYGRLPSVSEIVEKTALTQHQIYASASYKAGKIARASAKVADDMTGRSIRKSEFYGERSQEHCRRKNQNKAKQVEVDVLADQQRADDNSRFVIIR